MEDLAFHPQKERLFKNLHIMDIPGGYSVCPSLTPVLTCVPTMKNTGRSPVVPHQDACVLLLPSSFQLQEPLPRVSWDSFQMASYFLLLEGSRHVLPCGHIVSGEPWPFFPLETEYPCLLLDWVWSSIFFSKWDVSRNDSEPVWGPGLQRHN